ncbi:MAG: tetratricopeptide repeat protein, partial [Leptolyngbya sp. SIO4C5]|nr:tetratricopeptide repeat protein [Leptolyngbya sp. SIO4C5]
FLVERLSQPVVPVRWVNKAAVVREPQARGLQVLFMATSPEGEQPVLEFEQEEATILSITSELPLTLRVEESGCIDDLGKLWRRYEENCFDVFHLTGHASIQMQAPYAPFFITETLEGQSTETSATDLFAAFSRRLPSLIFLSGCRTAQAGNEGSVSSMAESLVNLGIPAVLGWGKPVIDWEATEAAKLLYERLAEGFPIAEALGETYHHLRQRQNPSVRDWHGLRLYVRGDGWGKLVNPPEFYVPALEPPQTEFLDPAGQVRVATAEQFVGRRRLLQRCLRQLHSRGYWGVLLWGLGGVGKSTVAARLLERLPDYDRVVIYKTLDRQNLLNLLSRQCQTEIGHEILNSKLPSMQKLTKFLKQGLNHDQQRFCFVLDDFEANLTADLSGKQVLRGEAVEPLRELLDAVVHSGRGHRIVITSRYDVTLPWHNQRLHRESLSALQGADLGKKYGRLEAFKPQPRDEPAPIDSDLQQQAKTAADGNPRLLEWLDKVLLTPDLDKAQILTRMNAEEERFREDILARELLAQQPEEVRQLLGRGLIYQLPVPLEAVAALCEDIGAFEQHQQRAVALGLLEMSQVRGELRYRVPQILQSLLPDELLPEQCEVAANQLYQLWWEAEGSNPTEEQCLEMHRLALLTGKAEIAAVIGSALAANWHSQNRYREATVLGIETLSLVKDYRVYHALARSEEVLGEADDAVKHYQKALKLCPETDEILKAATLNNMAQVIANKGDIDRAMALWQESLQLLERIGDVRGKAATLNNIAQVIANKGDIDRAMALWQESLQLKERIGDVRGKAATLNNMAQVIANKGDIDRAMALWQEDLQLSERIGDVRGKAATLNNMAQVIADKGDIDRAMALWQEDLQLSERIGDVRGKAATLNNMAQVIADKGDIDRAMALWQESLQLQERIGDVRGKAATLNNMAQVIADKGDIDRAMALWQESLQLLERIGDVRGKATTLNNMAQVIANKGDIDRAMALWQESLQLQERIGDVRGKATTLNNMAQVIADKGDIDRAMALWQESLQLLERIGDVSGKAATLNNMAQVIANKGDIDRAMALWQESLQLKERIGDVRGKAATLNNMALVIANKGDIDRAMALWQESLQLLERIGDVRGKAATLNNMALVIANKGDIDRAMALWQESLQLQERIGDVRGKAATLNNMAL